jgi:hypothetical protein
MALFFCRQKKNHCLTLDYLLRQILGQYHGFKLAESLPVIGRAEQRQDHKLLSNVIEGIFQGEVMNCHPMASGVSLHGAINYY